MAAAVGHAFASLARGGKHALTRLVPQTQREVTSITSENGAVKVLVTRGRSVIDYRIVEANPRHFREGLVSDAPRVAGLLQDAVQTMQGRHRRVIGAVPGYQTNLRRLDLPNVKSMDPKVIIPQEARRNLGISPENSYLTWHRLSASVDMAHWLVISATNRSISSLLATVQGAGLGMWSWT